MTVCWFALFRDPAALDVRVGQDDVTWLAGVLKTVPGLARSLILSRVQHMQRNKVVFDSAAALATALNSPVRHEMRAAFGRFPPFTGPITHFPMATLIVESGLDYPAWQVK